MKNEIQMFEDGEIIGGVSEPKAVSASFPLEMFTEQARTRRLAAEISAATYTNGKFGPNLAVEFRLEDGELMRSWFPCGLVQGRTTSSRFGAFVVAVLGSWQKFEPSELVGLPCVLEVLNPLHPDSWPRVTKVYPANRGRN